MKTQPEKNRNHRSQWTTAELCYVEAHYGKVPATIIAEYLGRTATAVRLVARKLGCSQHRNEIWTDEEKAIVRTHYANGEGIAALCKRLPGRSRKTIFMMAQTLGVRSPRGWNTDECRILRKYYSQLGTRTADKLPGRSPEAVKIKANALGLKFRGMAGMKMWSDEEWHRLEQYQHLPVNELAVHFPDRSLFSVKKARERLRIKQRR